MTKSQKVNAELDALIRARYAALWVVSLEEKRVESAIIGIAGARGYRVRFWDIHKGLWEINDDGKLAAVDDSIVDPVAIMNYIASTPVRALYILRDMHPWAKEPVPQRAIRNTARDLLAVASRDESRTMIFLGPSAEVPMELKETVTVVDYPLPEREEIGASLDLAVSRQSDEIRQRVATNGNRDRIIDSALGLSIHNAGNAFAKSIVMERDVSPELIADTKKKEIAKEKGIEVFLPDPRGLDAIGGNELLKAELMRLKNALPKDARDFGVDAPKGILIVGHPGCGKSLTAKCVPTAWGIPGFRLDVNALKSKWVGESEANIRRTLSIVDTMSPNILWIDEIDKAMGGAAQAGDSGVSKDAFGHILTWLQEREGTVFLVATANDIQALPPAFLRSGRFNSIWFVDLPNKREREAILAVTLRKYDRDPADIDLAAVARETDGFIGAEIANLVPEGILTTYIQGKRPLTTNDLIAVAAKVVPLKKTAGAEMQRLREFALVRARPASEPEESFAAEPAGRELDI